MANATLRPVADGAHDGTWTIVTGTDTGTAGVAASWIDETVADDSGYVRDNDTAGTTPATDLNRQSVTLTDLPEAATAINSVILYYRARSNFNGGSITPFARSGGTDYDQSAQGLTQTFTEYSVDITSVVSWTDSLINAMEIGWRKTSFANNEIRVSQAWVEVNYTPDSGGSESKSGSDSGTLAETATIAATLTATDSAALADAASVAATLAGTDSATLSDQSGVAAGVAGEDTGTLAEQSAIAADATTTDSATLDEVASLSVSLTSGDSLTLADRATVSEEGSEQEVGGGDSGTLDESASIAATLASDDSASLDDAATLEAGTQAADTLTLGEAVGSIGLATGDTGTLTEQAGLSATTATDDALAMGEAAALAATLASGDAFTFSESGFITVIGIGGPTTACAHLTIDSGARVALVIDSGTHATLVLEGC